MRMPDFVAAFAMGLIVAASGMASAAEVKTLRGAAPAKRPAAQQCLKELQVFDDELVRLGFGILPPGGYGIADPSTVLYSWGGEPTPRQIMRSLRDAAYVYAWGGDEQSCQMVLASMRAGYKDHQMLIGNEADDPDVRTAWRRAHLARAKPVADMGHLMSADQLIGSEIRNARDDRLGEINDIVLNPEQRGILYVLVSRGGFLGIGKQLVAVRWNDLRATEDHELYVLDVSAKAFADAPVVNRTNFEKTADAAWQRALGDYWNRAIPK